MNNMRREYEFTLFDFKPRSEFNKTKVRAVKYETLRERETLNANFQVTQIEYYELTLLLEVHDFLAG